jgi:hypothetical protein
MENQRSGESGWQRQYIWSAIEPCPPPLCLLVHSATAGAAAASIPAISTVPRAVEHTLCVLSLSASAHLAGSAVSSELVAMDAVALKNQLNTHVAYMFSAVSFHAQPPPLSPSLRWNWNCLSRWDCCGSRWSGRRRLVLT